MENTITSQQRKNDKNFDIKDLMDKMIEGFGG